jgi:hypothetical protein
MAGFCTEKGLGNQNAESAYYYCSSNGHLFEGLSYRQIGVGIVAGETVECMAELASSKLSWWKKGSKIAECSVPTEMRKKPIFISIMLYETGRVDLSL